MATTLCQYRYDALDRLVTCAPTEQDAVQRFYQKTRLSTEIQGQAQRAFFQHEDVLLAQQQHDGDSLATTLLFTDQQRSVLRAVNAQEDQPTAYTAYGHRPAESGLTSLLGFNGERRDPVTGHYLLGSGYRAFNPVLMRFNSPDSLSPFGKGGLNGYAYCGGDPINRVDPTGHIWTWVKAILRPLRLIGKSPRTGNIQGSKFTRKESNQLTVKSPSSSKLSTPISSTTSNTPPESAYPWKLSSAENTPKNLQTRRPLPALPSNTQFRTSWSSPDPSVIRPRHIYHLPKGLTHRARYFATPPGEYTRILTGDLSMNTIYEVPRDSFRQLKAQDVIKRGEGIRYK